MKRISLILLLLATTLCSRAAVETTDVNTRANAIYIEPSKGQIGTDFDVIIRVRSEIICSGYQTDILLPAGVSISGFDDYIITGKNIAWAYHENKGTYRLLHHKTVNPNDYDWEPGDYETIKMHLTADPSCVAGDYPITFFGIVLASETGEAGTGRYPEDVTSQLTLTDEPVYDEGYGLTVKSTSVRAGLCHDEDAPENSTWLVIPATNAAEVSNVSFTITMPDGVSVGTFTNKKKTFPDPYYASDTEYDAEVLPEMTDNKDGTYSVTGDISLAAGSADYIKIPLVTDGSLAAGIHEVALSDVEFTVTKPGYLGRIFKAAPSKGALIATGAALTSLDLTAVDGLDNTAIDVSDNPNTIIMAKAGQVSNTTNVVVDGVCAALTLTDGYPFGSPVPFTATAATYNRTMSNTWGTLCLPYPVSSNGDVQYYELLSSEVAADGTGTMTFTPIATVDANTPVVFRKLTAEGEISIGAANSPIAAISPLTLEKTALQWTLCGSYAPIVVTEVAQPYTFYIKDNKFYHINTSFNVKPFHAWFKGNEENQGKVSSYVISDDEGTTGINAIGASDTPATTTVYDLNGRRMNDESLAPGVYIKNNRKLIIP